MAILSTNLNSTPIAISPNLVTDSAVTVMLFCNLNAPDPLDDSVGRQNLDIHVVAAGSAVNTTNIIVNQVPVDAGDTFTFSTERLVLGPGDRIWAKTTDASQVSVTVSYVVI